MRQLVFFLEEPSAREMLKGYLPKILPEDVSPRFVVFEGKQDLEKQLEKRLRGWCVPDSLFIVLRDQDQQDCFAVKEKLIGFCNRSGKPEALVRIACRELESWYIGDFEAVEAGLGLTGLRRHAAKAKYRNPDDVVAPSRELRHLTNGQYQKVSGSRAIGPHLNSSRNRSNSFRVFSEGINRVLKHGKSNN